MHPTTAWEPGQGVSWLQALRGAHGTLWPADGVVVRAGPKRVLIRLRRRTGETVERWVRPASLRERSTTTLRVRLQP
jgi:hypothetical protein